MNNYKRGPAFVDYHAIFYIIHVPTLLIFILHNGLDRRRPLTHVNHTLSSRYCIIVMSRNSTLDAWHSLMVQLCACSATRVSIQTVIVKALARGET